MGFWRKEQITFFVSSVCNLSCIYCYMPKIDLGKNDKYIDLEFAKVGLEEFFKVSNSRTLRFFGAGEPTIAFEKIKAIRDYAYKLDKNIKCELETNGFFDESIANWVEENIDYLWISADGDPRTQDLQRPTISGDPSSKIVNKNIKKFAKNKNLQFGIRATISAENINKQIELLNYYNTLGVQYLCASPIYYSNVNPSVKSPSLLDFAKYFVPAFYHAKKLGMFYSTLLIVNFDEDVDIYCQAHIPTPRLTTDGFVSCCDWAALGGWYLKGKIHDELIYGVFDKERKQIIYDQNKIDNICRRNVAYLGENFCGSCEALKHCAGGCVGKMMARTNDLYKASDDWCSATKYLLKNLEIKEQFPFLHP